MHQVNVRSIVSVPRQMSPPMTDTAVVIRRVSLTTLGCFSSEFVRVADPGQQNDFVEPCHHLRAEPSAQSEELGQGVHGGEFGPRRGERRRHQRAAEADRVARRLVHGEPGDGRRTPGPSRTLPDPVLMGCSLRT